MHKDVYAINRPRRFLIPILSLAVLLSVYVNIREKTDAALISQLNRQKADYEEIIALVQADNSLQNRSFYYETFSHDDEKEREIKRYVRRLGLYELGVWHDGQIVEFSRYNPVPPIIRILLRSTKRKGYIYTEIGKWYGEEVDSLEGVYPTHSPQLKKIDENWYLYVPEKSD